MESKVANCYISVGELASFKENLIDVTNSENSFYVHHFGVTNKLWNTVKAEYSHLWNGNNFSGEKEEFEDAFYDTNDLSLIDQNYWLRRRSFKDDRKPEWSLKTTKRQENGYCRIIEYKIEDEIVKELKNFIPKKYQLDQIRFKGCDVVIGNFELNLFVFFPTTRLIFEKYENFKFYIDIAGEEYTTTWFLIGGIQFKDISQTDHLSQLSEVKWRPHVMSKVVQYLSWVNIDVFKKLEQEGNILSKDYSEEHIHSETLPYYPLP